ncbi:thioredoxin family protein [Microbacterium lacus]|uniref:thioredoxin family protein n=1 Tax=Microbacterium lacus TaxID=415217 RepID=UPI00384DDD0C
MKRTTVVGIVIAAVLVGGVGAAVAVSATGGAGQAAPTTSESTMAPPKESASASAMPSPAETTPVEQIPTAEALSPGAYVDYSDAALAAAEGARVLFFHAPWCPQCRALEEDIEANGVPDGVTILKVDYDSQQDLRQRYDVRLQTTLVALDDAGDGAGLFVAYDDPTLNAGLAGLGLTG